MEYGHSITDSVQRELNMSIYRKISNMNEELYDKGDVESIREFLSDVTTVSTPDFVIRRHVQTHSPKLLAGCQYQDLTQTRNVSWPKETINQLADRLFKLCSERNAEDPQNPKIDKASWIQILSGERTPTDRNIILKIAVVLQMDVDTTKSLFLACNQNAYSARNPQELIAYYCQHWPGLYQWADVQRLLHRYIQSAPSAPASVKKSARPAVIPGKTYVLSGKVEQLWNSDKPVQENEDELLQFMCSNTDQLSAGAKNKYGKYVVKDPGSATNRYYYMRFMQYLAVLYPTVQVLLRQPSDERRVKRIYNVSDETPENKSAPKTVNVKKAHIKKCSVHESTPKSNKKQEKSALDSALEQALQNASYPANTPVEILPNGLPSFPDLLAGMYQAVGWDFNGWKAKSASSIDSDSTASAYNDNDFSFVRNYDKRGPKILQKTGEASGSVSRRDVLLFGYFFLRAIVEADENTRQKISALYEGGNPIQPDKDIVPEDFAQLVAPFDQTMKKLVCGLTASDNDVGMFLSGFNDLLTCFHFIPLYLPSPFDRFALLSLLTDESDPILSQLLLCSDADR